MAEDIAEDMVVGMVDINLDQVDEAICIQHQIRFTLITLGIQVNTLKIIFVVLPNSPQYINQNLHSKYTSLLTVKL